jgi:hypothetical protein
MAVFLLKSKFGAAHPASVHRHRSPTCPAGGIFDPWIEELAGLAITGGCGGGLYCPNNAVTRQQMAVFLLKALEGSTYVPPTCTGVFDDVTCPSQFADWIEELADRQITGGCSVTPPLSARQPEQPRPDGGVPRQDVRPRALRRLIGLTVNSPRLRRPGEPSETAAGRPSSARPGVVSVFRGPLTEKHLTGSRRGVHEASIGRRTPMHTAPSPRPSASGVTGPASGNWPRRKPRRAKTFAGVLLFCSSPSPRPAWLRCPFSCPRPR